MEKRDQIGLVAQAAAIPPSRMEGKSMTIADLCLLLGVLIAFAALVVKVIEVSRK